MAVIFTRLEAVSLAPSRLHEPGHLGQAQCGQNFGRGPPIAERGEVQAVVGHAERRRIVGPAHRAENVGQQQPVRAGQLGDGIAIERHVRVIGRRIGQRRPEILRQQRRDEDDPGARRGECRDQSLESLAEMFQAGRSGKSLVVAVGDEDHGRPHRLDLLQQMVEAVAHRAEPGPGFAPHGVAAPAQVPHHDILARKAADQSGFQIAIGLLALDERAAQQHHAVAVGQFELAGPRGLRFGRSGCRGRHAGRHAWQAGQRNGERRQEPERELPWSKAHRAGPEIRRVALGLGGLPSKERTFVREV